MYSLDYINGKRYFKHNGDWYYIEYHRPINKNGKPSEKRWETRIISFTPLLQCAICKKVSTPKNIHARGYKGGIERYWWQIDAIKGEMHHGWTPEREVLCIRCWNRNAQIYYQEKLLIENIKLTKQLTTYLYHERKKSKRIDKSD